MIEGVFCMNIVITIDRPAPFPLGKRRAELVEAGGGIGSNRHADQSSQSGEVPARFDLFINLFGQDPTSQQQTPEGI